MPPAPQGQAVEPEATDAVDFCLLAVRWLRPSRLDAAIEGDRALGDLLPTSVDALARD